MHKSKLVEKVLECADIGGKDKNINDSLSEELRDYDCDDNCLIVSEGGLKVEKCAVPWENLSLSRVLSSN